MNEIIPGLFLGGIFALEEGTKILENKIYAIVTVGEFICDFHKPHLKNLTRIRVNIRDNETADLLSHISRVNSFIHRHRLNKRNVFVHCFGGVSRSASFIVAYLMTTVGIGLESALNLVKMRRKSAQPNENFLTQLKIFELELVVSERKRLKEEFSAENMEEELSEFQLLSI